MNVEYYPGINEFCLGVTFVARQNKLGEITITLPEHYSLVDRGNTLQWLIDAARAEMEKVMDKLIPV